MKAFYTTASIVVSILLNVSAAFSAEVVGDASFHVLTDASQFDTQSPGTFGTSSDLVTLGIASGAAASAHADGTVNHDANGIVRYYFEVLNAGGDIRVPVSLDYTLNVSTVKGATSDVGAQSSIRLFSDIGFAGDDLTSGDASVSSTRSGTLQIEVFANRVATITLSAYAVTRSGTDSSSADAYADPFLYIDPIFLRDHPDLTLEFSQGVMNAQVNAVPETSTWAMMILGFVGIGLIAHRGRSRNTSVSQA